MEQSKQLFVSGKTFGENRHAQRFSHLLSLWYKVSVSKSLHCCCFDLGNAPDDLELSLLNNMFTNFLSRIVVQECTLGYFLTWSCTGLANKPCMCPCPRSLLWYNAWALLTLPGNKYFSALSVMFAFAFAHTRMQAYCISFQGFQKSTSIDWTHWEAERAGLDNAKKVQAAKGMASVTVGMLSGQ